LAWGEEVVRCAWVPNFDSRARRESADLVDIRNAKIRVTSATDSYGCGVDSVAWRSAEE
jgi:hypothetical protein